MNADIEAILQEAEKAPIFKHSKIEKGHQNIITWLESKGGINFKKESWNGELKIAMENVPELKRAVHKNSGNTLDELSMMAYAEGWIREATPQYLLDAIEKKQRRIDVEEADLIYELEQQTWERR